MRGQSNIFRFRRASEHTFLTLLPQLINCTEGQPDHLLSVTQRCQYLGIHITYLAGPSTLEVPSHLVVNISVKSPQTEKPLKTTGGKQKYPSVFHCFLSDFCTHLVIVAT